MHCRLPLRNSPAEHSLRSASALIKHGKISVVQPHPSGAPGVHQEAVELIAAEETNQAN